MPGPVELLDQLYARELGCAPGDFDSGRIVTVANEQIGAIRFAKGVPLVLFSIARANSTIVSVLPRLKDAADRAMAGLTDRVEAYNALERALTPMVDVGFWFRGCRLYCAPDTFTGSVFGEVRDVTCLDETAEALHRTWGGRVFGQIVEGKAVAWAAVKPLSDVAWDLSVRTLPAHRGRGFAKSVVSAAMRHAFENGKLATWGTDTTNTASLRTAHSVGFQDYGFDFGCVERTTSF